MNSSRIDLDQILSQLPPWNLVLAIGGVDYPIRELRVSDLEKLGPAAMSNAAEPTKLVESLFEGKRPDMSKWSLEALTVVVTRIGGYAKKRAEKNSHLAMNIGSAAA